MATTITQKVVFKNTTPKAVYDLYMNAKKHSMITGAPVTISSKAGSKFSSHGGYIFGEQIHAIKDKLIVQNWRTLGWEKGDMDSTFILTLEPKGKDVVVQMVHANVPEKHVAGLVKGWNEHYWNPWKQHLAGKTITRPKM